MEILEPNSQDPRDKELEDEWIKRQQAFNRAVYIPLNYLKEGLMSEAEVYELIMQGTERVTEGVYTWSGEGEKGAVVTGTTAITLISETNHGIMDIIRTPRGIDLAVPTNKGYLRTNLFVSEGRFTVGEIEGFYYPEGSVGMQTVDASEIGITADGFIQGFREARPLHGRLDLF